MNQAGFQDLNAETAQLGRIKSLEEEQASDTLALQTGTSGLQARGAPIQAG